MALHGKLMGYMALHQKPYKLGTGYAPNLEKIGTFGSKFTGSFLVF